VSHATPRGLLHINVPMSSSGPKMHIANSDFPDDATIMSLVTRICIGVVGLDVMLRFDLPLCLGTAGCSQLSLCLCHSTVHVCHQKHKLKIFFLMAYLLFVVL